MGDYELLGKMSGAKEMEKWNGKQCKALSNQGGKLHHADCKASGWKFNNLNCSMTLFSNKLH